MDVDALWTNILGEIELEVNPGTYNTLFRQTHLLYTASSHTATVYSPNTQLSGMLRARYSNLIKHQLEKRLKNPMTVAFDVAAKPPTSSETGPLFNAPVQKESLVRQSGLNPAYTLKNFAVSEVNQMAYAASQAVAGKPGTSYNPLFLWGPTGVGKTHLTQAIGRQILTTQPNTKLMYCTAEEFTNDIIEAIRSRTTAAFKRRYRTVSVFMVDDVQFIAGRESVQMEFFHTFNSIFQAGGQIILTSDKPPSEIGKLEARLKSRFEGGLIVDIGPPNFELRTAILLTKAHERGVALSSELAKRLSASVEDVRALEGLLLRFISELDHEPDTEKIVSRLLKSPIPLERKKMPAHKIIDVVAGHFDLKTSQLVGQSRKKHIVEPRHILMYIMRQESGLSQTEVGALIGGRDHTTVMHAVEKIQALLPKNERLRNHLSSIRRLLGE